MAYSSAWLLRKPSIVRSSLVNSVVFYILVMMASMFIGAVFYFAQPSGVSIAEALGLNMVVMSVGVLVVLQYWARDAENSALSDEVELQRSIILSRVYVIYFLVMMASMTAVGFLYIMNTAITGLNEGLVLGNAIMVPGIAAILWYAYKHPNENLQTENENKKSLRLENSALIVLLLVNEFVMGWTFVLASEKSLITAGSLISGVGSTLNYVTGSDWFLFTLSFEILFSIFLLRRFLSPDFVKVACLQALTLLFVPTAVGGEIWQTACILANVAILAGLFFISLKKRQTKSISEVEKGPRRYTSTLLVLNSLIVAGSLVWILSGSAVLLYPCLIAEAVLYFNAILGQAGMAKKYRVTPSTVRGSTSLGVTPDRL